MENIKIIENRCYVKDIPISLTKLEFKLLSYLLEHKQCSRKELLKAIWNKDCDSRVLDAAISRLRKKIGGYIIAKYGEGYSIE